MQPIQNILTNDSSGWKGRVLIALLVLVFGAVLSLAFGFLKLPVAAGAVGVVCLLALAVRRPVWGLALLCSLLSVEGIYTRNLAMTEIRLVGILVFGVWLAHVVLYGKKLQINRTFIAGLIFLLWAGISILWAQDPQVAGRYYGTLAQLILLFLLTINAIETEADFRLVMAGLLLGAVASSHLSVNLFITNIIERARAFEAQDPNYYSLIVGLALFAGLYLFSKLKNIWLRFSSLLLACFLVLPLILAQSRTTWVATFAGIMMFLWNTKKRLRNILFAGLVVAAAIYATFALDLINVTLIQRASVLTALRDRGSDRFDIWLVARRIYADNPVIGVGYMQFPVVYNRYRSETVEIRNDLVPDRATHNVYIKAATEMGTIGLALFILIFWSAYREGNLPRGKIPWISSVLLVFVMTAGLGITIMESKFFWLCLALASKAQSLASQRLALEETR